MPRSIAALLVMFFALPALADDWTGKKVLPRREQSTIKIGDWVDGKQIYWTPHNLYNCTVREDKGGFLRLYDGRREGWVDKDDMVTAEDAPAWWTDSLRKDPNCTFCLWMVGIAWRDKGEYDNAIKSFTEVIRIDPKYDAAYTSRGSAWSAKKDYDKAIKDYDEAIRLDPKVAIPYYNRGNAWVKKKDYDKAIKDYDEAIRLDPKLVFAFSNRGKAWSAKKDYDKAIKDYDEAIRLDPKYVSVFNNRGWNWFSLKDYDKAIKDYDEAIRLDPKDVGTIINFAWLLATSLDEKYRNGKKAVEYGQRAVLLNNRDWHSFNTLAAAYAEAGEFEKAVATHTKAIEMLKAEKEMDRKSLEDAEKRLELYKAKKPYRQE